MDKDTQHIFALPQNPAGTAADDHTRSLQRHVLDHLLLHHVELAFLRQAIPLTKCHAVCHAKRKQQAV